jgi:hypothetical protein
MSQVDPWEKAAECARAFEYSIDPHRKAMLSNVMHMWIGLGHRCNSLTEDELALEAEAIGRLHATFTAPGSDRPIGGRHSKAA